LILLLTIVALSLPQARCLGRRAPRAAANVSNGNRKRGGRNRRNAKSDPVPVITEKIDCRPLSMKAAVGYGMILSLNSGFVNGICLSGLLSFDGTKQASAAVTGAWTNSALGLANGKMDQFSFNLSCILSYVFGSFSAGYVNPNPKIFEVSVVATRTLFIAASILLYSASVLCGEEEAGRSYILLALIANGIQNSVTSSATGNLVRSSHFSGISSDIGTFLGQFLRGNNDNLLKLKVFSTLALCFWSGGYLSFSMVESFGSSAILVSSALYMILAIGAGFL